MTVNLLVNFFTLVNLSSSSIHCFLTLIIDHYCSLCWTVTDLYREGKHVTLGSQNNRKLVYIQSRNTSGWPGAKKYYLR